MSARISRLLSTHHAGLVKKPAAWLWVAVWLLLNTQLALASHACHLQATLDAPAMQHMQHASAAETERHAAAEPVCGKHCVPDNAQQDHSGPVLAALPASTERVAVIPPVQYHGARPIWQMPPIVGPPAEIAFCCFRE